MIDIIDAPGKFFVQKNPCSDLNWHEPKSQTLFGSTAFRDCRLKFSRLHDDKEDQLTEFIESVITDPCPHFEFKNSDASVDV